MASSVGGGLSRWGAGQAAGVPPVTFIGLSKIISNLQRFMQTEVISKLRMKIISSRTTQCLLRSTEGPLRPTEDRLRRIGGVLKQTERAVSLHVSSGRQGILKMAH